jgi:eukaryotic-like serine/threonine-protein kinase
VEDERNKQLGSAPTTPAPPSPVPSPDLAAGSGPDSTLDMPAVDAATTTDLPAALGRFRVRKKLGEGGMGVVLDCVDADLGRRVAIKLVRTEADVPAYRARLLREAQAMARLEHPNVVRVYEVGSERGRLFIAMEYVDGVTLSAWLREPRPWPEVVEMFVRAGAGLSAVHGVGLVHRDFKPDNVLVDSTGRARVADFGLARLDGDAQPLTRTGVMMGTPGYMAPEQQFGSDVDGRADQYSFCVALREALGGRPLDDQRWKAVPEAVRAVVTRGLSYDADERFASMDALLAALAAAVPAPAKPKESRWPAALAVLAVLGAVSGVVAYVSSRRTDPAADKARPPALLAGGDDGAAPAAAVADAGLAINEPRDGALAINAPIDAAVATLHAHDAGVRVAVAAPRDAWPPADAGMAVVTAAPNTPGGPLVADGPTTKHLPAAKPGDPGHAPVVRAAIKDLGYDGFDVDRPPATLDDTDPIDQIKLGMIARRHGNCSDAEKRWTAAIATLKPTEPEDQATWAARAWLGRGLCSLGEGHAQDAWDQVSRAWVHGDRPVIQLVMAFAKYDLAVAANDYDGKNVAYGLLLTAEHLKDARVHAALGKWLDGLGLGLHQDAPIH